MRSGEQERSQYTGNNQFSNMSKQHEHKNSPSYGEQSYLNNLSNNYSQATQNKLPVSPSNLLNLDYNRSSKHTINQKPNQNRHISA